MELVLDQTTAIVHLAGREIQIVEDLTVIKVVEDTGNVLDRILVVVFLDGMEFPVQILIVMNKEVVILMEFVLDQIIAIVNQDGKNQIVVNLSVIQNVDLMEDVLHQIIVLVNQDGMDNLVQDFIVIF